MVGFFILGLLIYVIFFHTKSVIITILSYVIAGLCAWYYGSTNIVDFVMVFFVFFIADEIILNFLFMKKKKKEDS